MTDEPRSDGDTDAADRGVPGASLSTETTFSLLADRQRRRILAFLSEKDDRTSEVSDLVDHLVRESLDRRRVTTTLHHVHLPKLADAGVVEYDRRTGTVRYRGDPTVESALDAVGADLPLP